MKSTNNIIDTHINHRLTEEYKLNLFLILDCFLLDKVEHINKYDKNPPMNSSLKALFYAMVLSISIGCQNDVTPPTVLSEIKQASDRNNLPLPNYDRFKNGKIKYAKKHSSVFTPSSFDTLGFPKIDDKMLLAFKNQLQALKKRKGNRSQSIDGLDASIQNLEKTIEILVENADNPAAIKEKLTPYQTWGKDKKGHVKFTGYYSPIIRVRQFKSGLYQYPIYRRPKNWSGDLPSRAEISEGALNNKNLEIAFASNPVDVYYLQLQGSGYIQYVETGERLHLRYDGGNGKRYRSIETHLANRKDLKIGNLSNDGVKDFLRRNLEIRQEILNHNPSYTFFRESKTKVKGAGGVPLMEEISIAADTRYFPIGSVALASIPMYDKHGELTHHEFKLLLAQDVGGAVKGSGHVDVYSGIGTRGKIAASHRYDYGQLWLLLPNELSEEALALK